MKKEKEWKSINVFWVKKKTLPSLSRKGKKEELCVYVWVCMVVHSIYIKTKGEIIDLKRREKSGFSYIYQ